MTPDIWRAAQVGYLTIWQHRQAIWTFLPIPIFLAASNNFLFIFLTDEASSLDKGLALLPSFFIFGYVHAKFLRGWLTGEMPLAKIAMPETQTEVNALMVRAKAGISAILLYVLFQMGIHALLFLYETVFLTDFEMAIELEQVSTSIMLTSLCFLIFSIYAFRLFFLPIPAILRSSIIAFLKNLGVGFKPSFQMFGIWLFCSTPMILLVWLLAKPFLSALEPSEPTISLFLQLFIIQILAVTGGVIGEMITFAAVAFAFLPLLNINPEKTLFWQEKNVS